MNRIILIGNGFDLAHGLKTGYNDFILHYLIKSFALSNTTGKYEDQLITIIKEDGVLTEFTNLDLSDFVNYIVDKANKEVFNKRVHFKAGDKQYSKRSDYSLAVKSDLLRNILDRYNELRWVDIENIYYQCLKNCISDNYVNDHKK